MAAKSSSLYTNYTLYIFYGVLYSFTICISSAEVAKNLIDDCFGLIFGINTLVAVGFQTVLTLVVVSGLGLTISQQFLIYGFLYVFLGLVYFFGLIYEVYRRKHLPIE